ncbi:DNA-binding transcriptional MocR family regulator [Tamaricihabitans halophyticus]|uniref:DNA-binding transcriptional MocR family regulator n=1 Tax=Tamaricihabitans halophyticus TaxID=1262583 RepID=A0A4R2R216_9PSEU|nr:PLP-dependent aminotransferase family protein [Tamaricihabitans halophyticus]TCP56752.1 DNA-binding transcriptional MocR family regulator [Tamaricihabitans halophyticus]
MVHSRTVAELAELLGGWSVGTGPLYRKLADALARLINDGALRAGDRLPAERSLAGALATSRATVVGAYEELRGRKLIERRQGSGTTVAERVATPVGDGRVAGGRATAMFQRLIDGQGPLISLAWAAQGGSAEVAGALDEVLRYDMTQLLADPGYHPRGLPELREAIARYYTELGLPTSADQILVTTGAHQALVVVAEVYLRERARVVVEAPSWPACMDVFRAVKAELVSIGLDDEGIRIPELAATLAEQVPALLYVMPSHHNPTGILMSDARRRRIAELAAKYGVPILEDNAYAGIAHTESELPPPLAAYAPLGVETVTVESLGKAVWGGLRIGWLRGPVEIIERCARRKALADLGSPVIDQALAARLLPQLPDLAAKRAVEQRARLDQLEQLLTERLPAWSWRRPDGGASLWVALPEVHADVFAQLTLRHGVEVIPGSSMDPTGAHDNYVRIPFTHPPEVLTELVQRLGRAWDELCRHGPSESAPLRPII